MRRAALCGVLVLGCYQRPGEDGSTDTDNATTSSSTTMSGPTTNGPTSTSVGPTSATSPPTSTTQMGSTTDPDTGTTTGVDCGDGAVEGAEGCDDGNDEEGDGCDASCAIEDGWTCNDEDPSVCVAPDLAVQIIAAVHSGTNLDVTYNVTNVGGAASDPYRVDLWDTRNGDWNNPPSLGDSGVVTFADRPALNPGETDNFTDTVPNPPNGEHIAFVVVDTAEALPEEDENNNVSLGFAWTNGALNAHESFPTTETSTEIPDDGEAAVRADVAFPGFSPTIWVSLNITHPQVEDLTLELENPNGATRILTQLAVMGPNFQSTTFSDLVPVGIGSGTAPYSGEWLPEGDWSGGIMINGTWTLRVVDNNGDGRQGRINDFNVTLFELDP